MEPFDFLDEHSGSAVALATIALAGVTGLYVFLTHRLVRMQQVGPKREIVEKVYQPISGELEAVLWGDSPRVLSWIRLRDQEPFLIFHHLIPPPVRSDLDELAADWDSFSEQHQELSLPIAVAVMEVLNVEHEEKLKHPRVVVRIRYRATEEWGLVHFSCFLLPEKEVAEMFRYFEIDTALALAIWIQDGSAIIDEREIDKDRLSQILEQTTRILIASAPSREILEQYRARLRKVDVLYGGICHEIETGSHI